MILIENVLFEYHSNLLVMPKKKKKSWYLKIKNHLIGNKLFNLHVVYLAMIWHRFTFEAGHKVLDLGVVQKKLSKETRELHLL